METLITELVEAFGVNRGLAVVLMFLITGCGATLIVIMAVLIKQKGQQVRLNMHADHFTVIDENVDRIGKIAIKALDHSVEALKETYYTKGLLEGIYKRPNPYKEKAPEETPEAE